MLDILSFLDWLALFWFFFCWIGYSLFSHYRTQKYPSISTYLGSIRALWMAQILTREKRIADMNALGILQRNVTFFASTTIFILAGLLTVLGATDQVIKLTNALPFVMETTRAAWEIKLLLLILIFVYAFFKFTWCIRQYNFAIILVSSAPFEDAASSEKDRFVTHTNKLLTLANNSFAQGLRSYSFAMAILAWFIQPWLFILASTWVVAVLYRRDFRSNTIKLLQELNPLN